MFSWKIYIIQNTQNNKVYIGQTKLSLKQRFNTHKNKAKYKGGCRHLYNAIKKYGINIFYINIIAETSSPKLANYLEDNYIEEYDSVNFGYNIKKTNSGPNMFNEETKEKIRQSLLIYNEQNPQAGKEHSRVMKGRRASIETEYRSTITKEIKQEIFDKYCTGDFTMLDLSKIYNIKMHIIIYAIKTMKNENGIIFKNKKNNRFAIKTEFKQSNAPWNKGKKGDHYSQTTEFKKGMRASPATEYKLYFSLETETEIYNKICNKIRERREIIKINYILFPIMFSAQ